MNLGEQIMKILETDDHAIELHEVYITIDISELYAEIVEVYKENENGPGFILITIVKASEPKSSNQQDFNTDFRRFEP
jgi:hypothetical protein